VGFPGNPKAPPVAAAIETTLAKIGAARTRHASHHETLGSVIGSGCHYIIIHLPRLLGAGAGAFLKAGEARHNSGTWRANFFNGGAPIPRAAVASPVSQGPTTCSTYAVPPKTWFRIETEAEAFQNRRPWTMRWRYFNRPGAGRCRLRSTGRAPRHRAEHRPERTSERVPIFSPCATTRATLATAMLPPTGQTEREFRPCCGTQPDPIRVYRGHQALGKHCGLTLDPVRCFPYRRGFRAGRLSNVS
jgi:hypothetical protein